MGGGLEEEKEWVFRREQASKQRYRDKQVRYIKKEHRVRGQWKSCLEVSEETKFKNNLIHFYYICNITLIQLFWQMWGTI